MTLYKSSVQSEHPVDVDVEIRINGVLVRPVTDPNMIPPVGLTKDNQEAILAGLRAMQILRRRYSGVFTGNGDVTLTKWESLGYLAAITDAITAAGLDHETTTPQQAASIATSVKSWDMGFLQLSEVQPPIGVEQLAELSTGEFLQLESGPVVLFSIGDTEHTAKVVGKHVGTYATAQPVFFTARHVGPGLVELLVGPMHKDGWDCIQPL